MGMVRTKLRGLYIEILSQCNQKCIYCYNEKIIQQKNVLPLEIVERNLLKAKELGIDSVTFSGGEPLLYLQIGELLKYCHQLHMNVSIISNITLVNKEKALLLAKYNPKIQITVDSGDDCLHDLSRGNGTLEKQRQALSMLYESGYSGEVNVRTNLWGENSTYENIESVCDFAKENHLKYIRFALAHNTDFFHGSIGDMERKKDISKWVERVKEKYSDLVITFPEESVEFGCPLLQEKEEIECGFRIAPNGDVFPCQMFFDAEYCLGNIYKDTIDTIVTSEKLQRLLELLRLRKYYIHECQGCVCQCICEGGCPAKAVLDSGNIFTPSGACTQRNEVYQGLLMQALDDVM